jgi:hypothetical protein
MQQRLLRIALSGALVLAAPAVALAGSPNSHADKGQAKAGQHKDTKPGKPDEQGKPENPGKPDDTGKPETAGDRPHNHGWFVSQVAKSSDTTGAAHGEAVSTVAQSDAGK